MLHGTPTPAQTHRGRLAPALLLAVVVAILSLLAGPAHALSRTADVDPDGNLVRIVQLADGSLQVERGPEFHSAFHSASTATVIAEEQDVTLSTALVDLSDSLTDAGLIDDDRRTEQWGLDVLAAEAVWQRADGEGQVIAIIDSGVDGRHPDLRGQLVDGFSATGEDELVDGHGHGTHVAGTAAAAINGTGVAGLAHAARIMPIQVTDAEGLAYASDVAEGLIWAADHGATVANLSLAGTQRSTVLDVAIDYAIAQGVSVVVAAGNEHGRGNPRTYPASHPDVVAVGAVRDAETRSGFSSTGDWVDVMAPGSGVLSSRPDAAYGYASGTSMASPSVSAAIALLRSTTELTPAEVADVLTSTAVDLGQAGRDDETGHGLIDLLAALDELGVEAPVDAGTPDALPEDLPVDANAPAFDSTPAPAAPEADDHTSTDLDDTSWLAQGLGA